ncbi:MAG: hypothetical protein JWP01_2757 [Myxococcales bacterium]|nr:hypothetical protein [Myxococcales bacterium]
MDLIAPLLLIVGGILAISNLIVAKKPDAKAMIDKLVPFQAGIGVALLAFGLYNVITGFTGTPSVFDLIKYAPVMGLTVLAVIVVSILLGFMFGMPQIAKWMPGEGNAEQKGMELSKKLAPFQVILGLVGIGAALLFLLFRFRILGFM